MPDTSPVYDTIVRLFASPNEEPFQLAPRAPFARVNWSRTPVVGNGIGYGQPDV
jgi:hypothetical protein